MRDRRPIVDEAAAALADGVAVNWAAAIRRARSLEDRAVLRSLEAIGAVGVSLRPRAAVSGAASRRFSVLHPASWSVWRRARTISPAIARRTLLAVVVLPLVGIGVFALLQSPGAVPAHPVAAALVAFSFIVLVKLVIDDGLRRGIARTFDSRRGSDAVVAAVTSHIRDAADERELADRVEPIVATALCVQRVRLFVLDEAGAAFAHPRLRCAPLERDSALVAMLGDDDDVVAWDGERAGKMLQPDQQAWLEGGPFIALAPLRARTGELLGVLAVGNAEDGLPPDSTDLGAVRAVGCPIALVLEQVMARDTKDARVTDDDRPAAECRDCGLVLGALTSQCRCGGQTDTAALPQVVHNKFRIDRKLGVGAMGIAYLGRDLSLGRAVVVKALPRRSSATSRQLGTEARAMAAVTHPSLAAIFGLETWRGVPLLVMEFVPGGTLADCLRAGPLGQLQALAMGRSLAGGLEALHAAGLHHHDIKPANIALAAGGLPKLLDFGLAALDSEDTGRDELAGTPLYLSPEAVAGHEAGRSGDLWALAVVLYESVAGVNPFAGGDVADVLARVRAAQVPDVRTFCADASPQIAALLRDLLAAAPERRPATASEFGLRLGEVARALAVVETATAPAVFEIPPERQSGQTWLALSGGPASRL